MADLSINPSELRHCLAPLTRSQTTDDGGGKSEAWTPGDTFYAKLEPITGTERYKGMTIDGRVTHRIEARYRADLHTPQIRIQYGSRVFQVKASLNIEERNRKLVILAEEMGVGSG